MEEKKKVNLAVVSLSDDASLYLTDFDIYMWMSSPYLSGYCQILGRLSPCPFVVF